MLESSLQQALAVNTRSHARSNPDKRPPQLSPSTRSKLLIAMSPSMHTIHFELPIGQSTTGEVEESP